MSTDHQVPPAKPITKTFAVFDRSTGEILSIHHMSAAAGASLPDAQTLEAQALQTAAANLDRPCELGVTAHDAGAVDPANYRVDVESCRVIRRDADRTSL